VDPVLVSQYVLSGVVIGLIYSLMALGITFIYGIMKMINWGMGEFYMLGSYAQYALIATLLGPRRWWLALPLAMGAVFVLGLIIQRLLLRPMFVGVVERRDEYATIVTIAMMVFFRNLAIVVGGPNQYAPGDYAKPTRLGPLPISGNRFVALIATLVLLGLFYLVVKHTAIGLNFIDVYTRSGLYQTPLPNAVGREAAGVIVEVGPKVRGFKKGDRVAYCGVLGAYCQERVMGVEQLVQIGRIVIPGSAL